MAQSITINIDDVADANAIPDLVKALNYSGVNTVAAKAAFIKAFLAGVLRDKIRDYRIGQAMDTAMQTTTTSNSSIPIT